MLRFPYCAETFACREYLSPLCDLVRAANPSDFSGSWGESVEENLSEFFSCSLIGKVNALNLLDPKPGMSLLVLGSENGYFNVLAGLILGHRGVNHGVGAREKELSLAMDSVEKFLSGSPAVDKYDFCTPEFFSGNILELPFGIAYDRVFCTWDNFRGSIEAIARLVRDGGIVVFRNLFGLQKIIKTGEGSYEEIYRDVCVYCSRPLSYNSGENLVRLPKRNPSTLKELCRGSIRASLRKKIETRPEFLKERKLLGDSKKKLQSTGKRLYRLKRGNPWVSVKICGKEKRTYEKSYARELSSYAEDMKREILNLPAPLSLKQYLNFQRPF